MKFYDTINKYKDKAINLYVDMDGVIAEIVKVVHKAVKLCTI